MQLSKIFENEYKQLKLTRVRLKCDPANRKYPYEGYVLYENDDGSLEMFVVAGAPTQKMITIRPRDVDTNNCITNIEKLKNIIIGSMTDELLSNQISGLNCLADIEGMLLSNEYTLEDLYKFYKTYFLTSDNGVDLKEASVPGTTLRTKAGALATKIGSGYSKLNAAVQGFDKFSKGDLSTLSTVGDKLLGKQKDLDTNKVSMFGKKGYQSFIISDISVISTFYSSATAGLSPALAAQAGLRPALEAQEPVKNEYTINDIDNLIGLYEKFPSQPPGTPPNKYWRRDASPRGKGKLRELPNAGVVKPLPYTTGRDAKGWFARMTDPGKPDEVKPDPKPQPDPTLPERAQVKELRFKIIKKDNIVQKGIPYVLMPADENTINILLEHGITYAKFVIPADLSAHGKLYFYQGNGVYMPKFTKEYMPFVYQNPHYIANATYKPKVTPSTDSQAKKDAARHSAIVKGKASVSPTS